MLYFVKDTISVGTEALCQGLLDGIEHCQLQPLIGVQITPSDFVLKHVTNGLDNLSLHLVVYLGYMELDNFGNFASGYDTEVGLPIDELITGVL